MGKIQGQHCAPVLRVVALVSTNLSPLGLGLGLVLLLLGFLTTLVLDVLVVDSHGFVDLGTESIVVIDTEREMVSVWSK